MRDFYFSLATLWLQGNGILQPSQCPHGAVRGFGELGYILENAEDMYQWAELVWLIYNALREYAELVVEGDVGKYLREVKYI